MVYESVTPPKLQDRPATAAVPDIQVAKQGATHSSAFAANQGAERKAVLLPACLSKANVSKNGAYGACSTADRAATGAKTQVPIRKNPPGCTSESQVLQLWAVCCCMIQICASFIE